MAEPGERVFESGNPAVLLLWTAVAAAVFTLIFGYVAYCLLFTPM
jgi:hypothetical protein